MGPKKETSISFVGQIYLFFYNFCQVLGWSWVLWLTLSHYLCGGERDALWNDVRPPLMIFQNAAILEVLNVMIKLVKSNLALTFFQVASRVIVVCGVLTATPTAPLSLGLPLLLIAWSITEVIRYSFYAINIFTKVPSFIIWARYTFFYALYPLGVTGELLCFYAAQEYIGKKKQWSIEMPNNANFTFSYQYLLLGLMLLYIPLFPQLYFHMISLRKKVLGGSSEKKTT